MSPGTVVTILPKGWKGQVLARRHQHPWWPTYYVGAAWYPPSQLTAEAAVVTLPPSRKDQQ